MVNHLSNILIETFGVPLEEVKSAQRTQREKGGRTEEILIQKKVSLEKDMVLQDGAIMDQAGTTWARAVRDMAI